jgi:hypothetical protein
MSQEMAELCRPEKLRGFNDTQRHPFIILTCYKDSYTGIPTHSSLHGGLQEIWALKHGMLLADAGLEVRVLRLPLGVADLTKPQLKIDLDTFCLQHGPYRLQLHIDDAPLLDDYYHSLPRSLLRQAHIPPPTSYPTRRARNAFLKRMRAKVQSLKQELHQRVHDPIPEQGAWLRTVLLGHYRYYGVPMNGPALRAFWKEVIRVWRTALRRRSQRGRITRRRMDRLIQDWLPLPRI